MSKRMNLIFNYIEKFFKWIIVAVITGIIGGFVGSYFHIFIAKATEIRMANPIIIYFLPIAGLLIVLIYKLTKMDGVSTNTVINSIQSGEKVSLSLLPAIFSSTILTHLFGGSAGKEGAALQIGGSIGDTFGRLLKLEEKDQRIAVFCGMSAVFASLFGTPITAAIYSLEFISVGIIHYSALAPSIVAALVAFFISLKIGLEPTSFKLENTSFSIEILIKVLVLALLCAVVSIFFVTMMHKVAHLFKNIKNEYLRVAVGGIVIILFTIVIRTYDYNGAGMNIVVRAIEEGKANNFAFLFKILLTAITIGCGFKGGEIVPTFFIGATFGCVVGPLLGLDPKLAAAIALVAVFCGAVNSPLASIVLSMELFGGVNLVYFSLACAISYTLSGYYGLYKSQRIMYSKVDPEFINIKAI